MFGLNQGILSTILGASQPFPNLVSGLRVVGEFRVVLEEGRTTDGSWPGQLGGAVPFLSSLLSFALELLRRGGGAGLAGEEAPPGKKSDGSFLLSSGGGGDRGNPVRTRPPGALA